MSVAAGGSGLGCPRLIATWDDFRALVEQVTHPRDLSAGRFCGSECSAVRRRSAACARGPARTAAARVQAELVRAFGDGPASWCSSAPSPTWRWSTGPRTCSTP